MHRRAVEVEEVFELELHPALTHEPGRPAIEAREGDEQRAHLAAAAARLLQIGERVARVLYDVGQHRDVERALRQRQMLSIDPCRTHSLAEPLVRRADRARRVFHASHVVAAVAGFEQQIAEAGADFEQTPARSIRRAVARQLGLNRVEIARRRTPLETIGFGAGDEEVLLCIDRRQLAV